MEKVPLTPREKEMLIGLAKGKSYKQIAACKSVTVETVHKHLKNAYEKLGAKNGPHAVAIAVREKEIE